MVRVFVPQPIPPGATARLEALGDVTVFGATDRAITRQEVLDGVADAEVLIAVGDVAYDAEVLAAAPRLRLVAAMQSSPRLIDVEQATARGIPVTVLPNLSADATAEHTVALLLAALRRIPEGDRAVREGRWHQRQSMQGIGTSLTGKTVAILGCGTVGQGVARRLRGFDVDLTYTRRTRLPPDLERELGLAYRALDDLLPDADVLVVTVASTPATRGLVGEDLLRRLPAHAIVVNTARGAVLDEDALEACLRRGGIRGAALDVFEHEVTSQERIGPRPSLLELPNVVVTPHLGSATRETREAMAGRVVDAVAAVLRGERPADLVNPEVLLADG